jgi:hypothetical protein
MSHERLRTVRLFPRDLEVLERRARELAAGEEAALGDGQEGASRLVLFRLRGMACALDAGPVSRAVARLDGAAPVPMAEGGDRTVAFVEEQPLPVVDLAGAAAGAERGAAAIAGGPALVLETAAGPVAVAVEGPLDLCEERLSGAVAERLESGLPGLRLAGRLADGTSVLDAAWLLGWAGKAVRT